MQRISRTSSTVHHPAAVIQNDAHMHRVFKVLTAILALAALTVVVYLVYPAFVESAAGHGLVRYFARLGIEVDLRAAVIAVGLIPVFWLAGFIIRTWSVKE